MINKSVKSKEAKKDNKSSPKSGRMIGSVQNYRDLKSHKSTKIVCYHQISHIFHSSTTVQIFPTEVCISSAKIV